MFQTNAVENNKTHIWCSVTFISKIVPFMRECGKNTVEPDSPTDYTIIRRMLFACYITNATDTHSEYVMLLAFP